MTKAYSVLTVKSASDSDDERIITGIASTPSTDRDGDIIEPTGAKFALPIPLLWQHNHNQPIGEVTKATVTDTGIEFTAKLAKIDDAGTLKDRLDEAWQSIKSGLVKCLSIGFKMTEYNYIKDGWGYHIKEWEWWELSVVTIPANPDAVISSAKDIKNAFAKAEQVAFSSDKDKPAFGSSDVADDDIPPSMKRTTTDPVSDVTGAEATKPTKTETSINLIDPNKGGVKLL